MHPVKQLYEMFIIVTSPVVSMQRGCRDLLVSRRENLTETGVFYPCSSSDANISPELHNLTNCSLIEPGGPFCLMFGMGFKGYVYRPTLIQGMDHPCHKHDKLNDAG